MEIFSGETEIRELQNLANIRNNIDLNAPISIIIQDIISPDLLADNEINVNLAKGVASYYNRNVILVNLDAITNQNYGCIANVIAPKVADYLADVILSLLQICRIDWNTLWIGGHGIGAHIAGLTSDRLPIKVKVCWGKLIFVIDIKFFVSNAISIWEKKKTALDPLGLLYDRGLAPGLRPCSCETVYAVYTSTALLGSRSQVGTINVYVNGAAVQPGCELFVVPLCSHIRAVLLDSVARQNPLNISSSAGSTFEFLNHEIPPGEYHLQTTGCLPFI